MKLSEFRSLLNALAGLGGLGFPKFREEDLYWIAGKWDTRPIGSYDLEGKDLEFAVEMPNRSRVALPIEQMKLSCSRGHYEEAALTALTALVPGTPMEEFYRRQLQLPDVVEGRKKAFREALQPVLGGPVPPDPHVIVKSFGAQVLGSSPRRWKCTDYRPEDGTLEMVYETGDGKLAPAILFYGRAPVIVQYERTKGIEAPFLGGQGEWVEIFRPA